MRRPMQRRVRNRVSCDQASSRAVETAAATARSPPARTRRPGRLRRPAHRRVRNRRAATRLRPGRLKPRLRRHEVRLRGLGGPTACGVPCTGASATGELRPGFVPALLRRGGRGAVDGVRPAPHPPPRRPAGRPSGADAAGAVRLRRRGRSLRQRPPARPAAVRHPAIVWACVVQSVMLDAGCRGNPGRMSHGRSGCRPEGRAPATAGSRR